MPTFRKRPLEVDAWQFDPDVPRGEWPEWMREPSVRIGQFFAIGQPDKAQHLAIHTLEGVMHAQPGDWIIKGVKGELYPCKPDIFAETYEEPKAPSAQSDGALLAELGTDAQKWADAFIDHIDLTQKLDEGYIIGWFANAIEAGRSAGQSEMIDQAREERQTNAPAPSAEDAPASDSAVQPGEDGGGEPPLEAC